MMRVCVPRLSASLDRNFKASSIGTAVLTDYLLSTMGVLAQAEGAGSMGALAQMLPFILIVALAYVMFFLPQKRKEQQHRDMVQNLKENDHVITSGGIYGVVTSVQRDAERVTLRVDDATGAKMRVGLWAISQVLDEKAEGSSKNPKAGDSRNKK